MAAALPAMEGGPLHPDLTKPVKSIADKWKQARKNLKSAWMAEIDAIDIRPALLRPQA